MELPFKADQVGSFLRSEKLKVARQQYADQQIRKEQLTAVEDQEIIALIQKQVENGMHAVTDGEFRRSWWHFDFLGDLDGMELYSKSQGLDFHKMETRKEGVKVVGKIKFGEHPFLQHFAFLKAHTPEGFVPKQTIPSPNMLHARADFDDTIYANIDELIEDLIVAYQDGIQAFYDLGCRYLQLDDTSWASLFSDEGREKLVAQGIDPQVFLERLVYVLNASIAKKPADMCITMHICRGNYKSNYFSSGGYDFAGEAIFSRLNVDGLFLEFDDERSGSFEPLQFVNRPDLKVVLGLVTSKFAALESKEDIAARIAQAEKYVPKAQLCLSPQCGFSSTEEGNIITEDEQWAKIRYVVELAKELL